MQQRVSHIFVASALGLILALGACTDTQDEPGPSTGTCPSGKCDGFAERVDDFYSDMRSISLDDLVDGIRAVAADFQGVEVICILVSTEYAETVHVRPEEFTGIDLDRHVIAIQFETGPDFELMGDDLDEISAILVADYGILVAAGIPVVAFRAKVVAVDQFFPIVGLRFGSDAPLAEPTRHPQARVVKAY